MTIDNLRSDSDDLNRYKQVTRASAGAKVTLEWIKIARPPAPEEIVKLEPGNIVWPPAVEEIVEVEEEELEP